MNKNNVAIAEAYYTAMAEKNITEMGKYLHSNVQLTGPLGSIEGKEAVLEAAKKLISSLKTLTIRAKCDSEDQAMIAFDLDFDEPIGKLRSVALLTIRDGLIVNNELFFDARPFQQK